MKHETKYTKTERNEMKHNEIYQNETKRNEMLVCWGHLGV